MREIDQKQAEIADTKASIRNLYLKLKKERKDTFLISSGYLFGKLVNLTSYEEAEQFRKICLDEHNEKERLLVNRLGVEFMDLSSKPTKDRQQDHDDRKQEMIDEGIRIDRQLEKHCNIMKDRNS